MKFGINILVLISSSHTYLNDQNWPSRYVFMTSYVMAELKIAIYSQNRPKNQKNSKKVLNIGISSGFLHIMKGNGNSSMSCEFELHSMRIFFKMTIFCFKKLIWVPSTPPHLPSLTAYPTPTLGGTPNFFSSK